MLCLNIVSNYVIYNAKNIFKDDINSDLYKSSLILSRYIQNNQVTSISEADEKQFLYKYKLDDIVLLPSMPKEYSKEAKLRWLNSILFHVPQEDILKISGILLTSEFYTLTRGENDQYYFVVPVSMGRNNNILILSKKIRKLAYLDDASDTLVIISMITLFAIMLIYFLLYRFILSPFRKRKYMEEDVQSFNVYEIEGFLKDMDLSEFRDEQEEIDSILEDNYDYLEVTSDGDIYGIKGGTSYDMFYNFLEPGTFEEVKKEYGEER